jgi:nicotinamidase-related amidase
MEEYTIPSFYDDSRVGEVWKVPYQERAEQASNWREDHDIPLASQDEKTVALMMIDVQNTFCVSDFELFVSGAVEDNDRLCRFIYRNLGNITNIAPTMDTHTAMQIFHADFWIDENGNHPEPNTIISAEDVVNGVWQVNPAVAYSIGNYMALQRHGNLYTQALEDIDKYPLIIWPYHAMLGGIGHALVSSVEEAAFFHNICRASQTDFRIKGGNPLTENYSVFNPEVRETIKVIAQKNTGFLEKLMDFDAVVIAGQAKSHCVAWTINDLLDEIMDQDPSLVEKVFLLEDCTSPVVIPDVVDFTDQADEAFERFEDAGMHIVQSTDDMNDWDI